MPRTDPKAQYELIEKAVREREADIVQTLAKGLDPQRLINVGLQGITRSPRLLQCTPASIIMALRDAAELGLEPSGLMGSAYLVPYRNKKTQKYEAKLIPGYRGLIDLARRSGEVKTVEAHVVRERDVFDYAYGTDAFLIHKPFLNRGELDDEDKPLDGGRYIGAYALAKLTSGDAQFEVMDIPQIEAIRARSRAADDGPWVTDWAEMARKTPTRKLLKYLPLSVMQLQRALELEDIAEGEAVAVQSEAPKRKALTELLTAEPVDDPNVITDAELDELVIPETATPEVEGSAEPK